jgi:hypothetical protein
MFRPPMLSAVTVRSNAVLLAFQTTLAEVVVTVSGRPRWSL